MAGVRCGREPSVQGLGHRTTLPQGRREFRLPARLLFRPECHTPFPETCLWDLKSESNEGYSPNQMAKRIQTQELIIKMVWNREPRDTVWNLCGVLAVSQILRDKGAI